MFGMFHILHRCHSDDPRFHRGEEETLPLDNFSMTPCFGFHANAGGRSAAAPAFSGGRRDLGNGLVRGWLRVRAVLVPENL